MERALLARLIRQSAKKVLGPTRRKRLIIFNRWNDAVWQFDHIKDHFKYIRMQGKLKLQERAYGIDIINTFLLNNLLIGFNDNAANTYFGVKPVSTYDILNHEK